MKNNLLICFFLSLLYCNQSFAQNKNNDIFIGSLSKPNFFPKKIIQSYSIISLGNSIINYDEMKKIDTNEKEINHLIEYYKEKTSSFFKSKKVEGAISFLVTVSTNIPEDKTVDCKKTPTKCFVTQIKYILSDNIDPTYRNQYYQYITKSTQENGIEILPNNFFYSDYFKFGFQIFLDKNSINTIDYTKEINDFVFESETFDSPHTITNKKTDNINI